MKTKSIVLITVLVLATLLLVACGGGGSNSGIVGKWKPDGGLGGADLPAEVQDKVVMEFTKDGKMLTLVGEKEIADYMADQLKDAGLTDEQIKPLTDSMRGIAYKVDGDKLTIIQKADGKEEKSEATFKIEGDKLTITEDKNTQNFTRVK